MLLEKNPFRNLVVALANRLQKLWMQSMSLEGAQDKTMKLFLILAFVYVVRRLSSLVTKVIKKLVGNQKPEDPANPLFSQ
jgi:hypothetical protein